MVTSSIARLDIRALALVAALAACASTPKPAAQPPAPASSLPPLPRSSIAAVVQHRGELGLTDEQVRQMEVRDQQRETEDAAIRDELAKRRAAKAGAQGSSSGASPSAAGGGGSGGGMRGGGMGMGGGMRGGGMRGGRMPRGPAGEGSKGNPEATAQDRMDENDTKAYLDAEGVLTDAQKAKARDIAEDYREQLYDRRAAAAASSSTNK